MDLMAMEVTDTVADTDMAAAWVAAVVAWAWPEE
jgi:hypothetical protein